MITFLLLVAPGLIVGYFLFLRPVLRALPQLKEFYAEADGFWTKVWAVCGKSVTMVWGLILQGIAWLLQWIEPIGQLFGDPDVKQQLTEALQADPKILGYVLMAISFITLASRLRSLGQS